MKCMGDFGALSPEQRTRIRQREPAMIKPVKKTQTLYYSEPVSSVQKPMVAAKKKPVKAMKKVKVKKTAPKKTAPKKPGFFARLFGRGKKKAPAPVKSSVVRPANAKVMVKPVAQPKKKVAVKPKVKAPKKVVKKVAKASKPKKVTKVKTKGMSGNYYMGDFGEMGFKMPKIKMPKVKLPKITMPKIKLPNISLGGEKKPKPITVETPALAPTEVIAPQSIAEAFQPKSGPNKALIAGAAGLGAVALGAFFFLKD